MGEQWKKRASAAYGYSLTRLCLNFYAYLDRMADAGQERETVSEVDEFCKNLKRFLDGESQSGLTTALRNRMILAMQTVTSMTDCFGLYEYALNRIERRFVEDTSAVTVPEEELVGRLLRYVSEGVQSDTSAQRIQKIVAEMPVRYTRQKFYEMVQEGLMAYAGSDAAALSDMMYQLKSVSAVDCINRKPDGDPVLLEYLGFLEELPWKDMSTGQYREAVDRIVLAGERLYRQSDDLVMIQELVGDLCVLELTAESADHGMETEVHARAILAGLLAWKEENGREGIPDSVTELLSHLEGMQEQYYNQYQRLSSVREDCGEEYKLDILLSTSIFASLDQVCAGGTVSGEDVVRTAKEFFAELNPVFDAVPRLVSRAIMAAVLSYLPFYFQTIGEFEEYLRGSFQACEDLKEKETCRELLMQMMESEDYALV